MVVEKHKAGSGSFQVTVPVKTVCGRINCIISGSVINQMTILNPLDFLEGKVTA